MTTAADHVLVPDGTTDERVRSSRRGWIVAGVLLLLALLAIALAGSGTGYGYAPISSLAAGTGGPRPDLPADAASSKKFQRKVQDRIRRAETQLGQLQMKGLHVVVDQTHNRLYIKRGDQVLREAVCSAGSGMVLRDGPTGRKWVFDTPRGYFTVKNIVSNPIWKKPDWAFVEEGKPIPKDPQERFESGTLGEYAFYLGDGYMIHGTLYTRLLGRSVTHGCIRLGQDDLRALHDLAGIGTPVFIF